MKKITALAAGFAILSSQAFAQAYEYEIKANKINALRGNISPKTGTSAFNFSASDIENLPQGQMTSMNQLLARAPSVVQDANNRVHVRGEHGNLQYRINGVMLPDAVGSFGQIIDAHFVKDVSLLTGAMSAQYGFKNAGVVDVKTKTGSETTQNRSEAMVGSFNTLAANHQVSGSRKIEGSNNKVEYFLSATYLQNDRGLDNTSSRAEPKHNETSQDNLFGYFSYMIESAKRLSVVVFDATNRYQIPNNAGQDAQYNLPLTSVTSDGRNQKQFESNRFATASLQGVTDMDIDYTVSVFAREGILRSRPDFANDLVFNGVSSDISREARSIGLQGDFTYQLDAANTLKAGLYASDDSIDNTNSYSVFPVNGLGVQTSNNPNVIRQNGSKDAQLYGVYLQNEWKVDSKLSVNYGARIDMSRADNNESAFSPRVNATYNLDAKTMLHGGYARYFTTPSLVSSPQVNTGAFAGTSGAYAVSTNSQVKAERADYFDVGVSHKLNKNVNLAFDVYYKEAKNMLDEHQMANSLAYVAFNYDKGRTYGAEFKSEYVKDNFSSFFNLATQHAYGKGFNSSQYLNSQAETSHAANNHIALDHTQTYTASIGANYTYLQTKYGVDALYGSGLRAGQNNHNTMPAYWQFNGSVSRNFNLPYVGRTNLRVAGLNLLDNNHRYSNGSGVGTSAAQYAVRRSVYLIASKNF